MTLHIITVAYGRPIQLRTLIDCFLVQTDNRWMLHIIYDGPAPQEVQEVIGLYNDNRVNFYCSEHRNGNYGHPNRRKMLEKLKAEPDDFILMTNDDNYYVPLFVEYMLQQGTHTVGIVYCNTTHSHFQYREQVTQLKENFVDMGSFIVMARVAKAAGFKYDDFSADGKYAEECALYCRANSLQTIHVPKCLFIHN
jgi:hypothetical protein